MEGYDGTDPKGEQKTKPDLFPYPNAWKYRDTASINASDEEKEATDMELRRLGREVFEEYGDMEIEGKNLWIDFIKTFWPH